MRVWRKLGRLMELSLVSTLFIVLQVNSMAWVCNRQHSYWEPSMASALSTLSCYLTISRYTTDFRAGTHCLVLAWHVHQYILTCAGITPLWCAVQCGLFIPGMLGLSIKWPVMSSLGIVTSFVSIVSTRITLYWYANRRLFLINTIACLEIPPFLLWTNP